MKHREVRKLARYLTACKRQSQYRTPVSSCGPPSIPFCPLSADGRNSSSERLHGFQRPPQLAGGRAKIQTRTCLTPGHLPLLSKAFLGAGSQTTTPSHAVPLGKPCLSQSLLRACWHMWLKPWLPLRGAVHRASSFIH